MTCKDCIHYDVCYYIEHYGREIETSEPCKKFKSKYDVVGHGKWLVVEYPHKYECSECYFEWRVMGFGDHPRDNEAFHCPCCGNHMDKD